MESVGDRIRNKRIELGMTQDDLAKKVGYKNRSSINALEKSTVIPIKKLTAIANALDVEPSYLMGWEKPEYKTGEIAEPPAQYHYGLSYEDYMNQIYKDLVFIEKQGDEAIIKSVYHYIEAIVKK